VPPSLVHQRDVAADERRREGAVVVVSVEEPLGYVGRDLDDAGPAFRDVFGYTQLACERNRIDPAALDLVPRERSVTPFLTAAVVLQFSERGDVGRDPPSDMEVLARHVDPTVLVGGRGEGVPCVEEVCDLADESAAGDVGGLEGVAARRP
jgi:hypothetical protein